MHPNTSRKANGGTFNQTTIASCFDICNLFNQKALLHFHGDQVGSCFFYGDLRSKVACPKHMSKSMANKIIIWQSKATSELGPVWLPQICRFPSLMSLPTASCSRCANNPFQPVKRTSFALASSKINVSHAPMCGRPLLLSFKPAGPASLAVPAIGQRGRTWR